MAAWKQQFDRVYPLLAAVLAWLGIANWANAQRVQLPTPATTPLPATSAPPTFAPVAPGGGIVISPPTFDAYSGSGFGAALPAYPNAYGVAPPTLGAPQTVPYSPAPVQPFTAQPSVTQPPAPLFQGNSPFGWESGTYSYQAPAAGDVTFTKLVQKLDGEYTHLFGGNGIEELQLNRIEVTTTLAWPLGGSIENPLLITPGFVANFFDFEGAPEFEAYEAFVDAAWFPQFNEGFGAELGLRTGVWTDFDEVNSDSLRILGRGLAVVRVSPALEVLAGVVYLDRRRIKLLPAGGLRWRPREDVHFDLVFPNPVARKRLRSEGDWQWWAFVAGEYGGGSWTDSDDPQGYDYNDVRISLGLEFETLSRVTGSVEVGYVFEREFYQLGAAATNLDETVMLRAGINL